jgi:WhiB family redox-sensing transcriptional regulator
MTRPLTLPLPLADAWDWQRLAACRGMASSLFFHPDNERGPARQLRVARAKEVCASCPVLERCRAHAVHAAEPYGTWGGISESERRKADGRCLHTDRSTCHNHVVTTITVAAPRRSENTETCPSSS